MSHRPRQIRRALLVALTLVAAACGMPYGSEAESAGQESPTSTAAIPNWGACTGASEPGSNLAALIADHAWILYTNEQMASALDQRAEARRGHLSIPTRGTTAPKGVSPDSIVLSKYILSDLNEAIGLGSDFVVGWLPSHPDAYTPWVVALLRTNESALFLHECTTTHTALINETARSQAPQSPLDLVIASLSGSTPEFVHLRSVLDRQVELSTRPWEESPAENRIIDPSVTPREVLDSLLVSRVVVAIDESWRGAGLDICLKTSLGWHGECVPTDIDVGAAEFGAHSVVGEPSEVWSTASTDMTLDPIAKLGQIEASALRASSLEDSVILTTIGPRTETTTTLTAAVVSVDVVSSEEANSLIEAKTPRGTVVDGP